MRSKIRWNPNEPIEDWATALVGRWNHSERVAIMKEFDRISREEHKARLDART